MKYLFCIFFPFVFFSCKKEVPNVFDFVAVKNTLRAMNEVTSIVELIDHSQKMNTINTWFYYQNQIGLDTFFTSNLNDVDTFYLSFNSPISNHDKRLRKGKLRCTFTQEYGDSGQVSNISFDSYFCNNVQISGNLSILQLSTLSQEDANNPQSYMQQITGNLTFKLFDGTTFSFQPNLIRDYKVGESFYTGSATGTDVNNETFNFQTITTLKKAAPFVDRGYFYNGQLFLNQGSETGKIWYGYQDIIDNYGFVERLSGKYNFFLDDY